MTEVNSLKPEVQVQKLVNRAEMCSSKGSFTVYNQFKQDLDRIEGISSQDYETACIKIARALRV